MGKPRKHIRRAIQVMDAVGRGQEFRTGVFWSQLSDVYRLRGQLQRAEKALRTAIGLLERTLPVGHAQIATAEYKMGELLGEEHKNEEARGWLLQSYDHLLREEEPSQAALQRVRHDLRVISTRLHDQAHEQWFAADVDLAEMRRAQSPATPVAKTNR